MKSLWNIFESALINMLYANWQHVWFDWKVPTGLWFLRQISTVKLLELLWNFRIVNKIRTLKEHSSWRVWQNRNRSFVHGRQHVQIRQMALVDPEQKSQHHEVVRKRILGHVQVGQEIFHNFLIWHASIDLFFKQQYVSHLVQENQQAWLDGQVSRNDLGLNAQSRY